MDGDREAPRPERATSGKEVVRHTAVLKDDREQVEIAVSELLETMARLGFDDGSAFAVRLAVEEAINNGFRHGNKSHPGKVVRLQWEADAAHIVLQVTDEGEGFDPGAVPDPTAEENLEIPSGRGLMLMRAYMSEVEYVEPGNRVRMVYERKE